MNSEIKEKVPQILEEIKKAENILLHLHVKPDPDSFGSALAMKFALESSGKKVTLIKGDSPLSESFSFLPGYLEIAEKNYFEVDLADLDLFIILDSGSKEMISRENEINFPENLKTIVIDHHQTNEGYADINLVNIESSSTAELVFDLMKEWEIVINENIAANLYIGIFGDTGGFRHPNTTPHTLKVASELAEIYPNFSDLISALSLNNPKESIIFKKLLLNNLEIHFDDRVALSSASLKEMQENGIDPEKISGNDLPNLFITVKEWQIGVTLNEKEENKISISFRAKGDIDVSKMAAEIGGGGHKLASGAFLECSLEEAKEKVLSAIEKHL